MTKLKSIVLAVASFVIFTNISNAQAAKATYSVNAVNREDPFQVKYLGDDGNYLLFQVTLQSTESQNVRFSIDDKNEGQLYAAAITSNFKGSIVKIEKQAEDQVLNFKLYLGKKKYLKSFSINKNLVETTTVAERDITKL